MDQSENASTQSWEQKLINDYYHYRWEYVLKPLCATAQRWKAGELAIADMADALEDVNEHVCELRNLFSQRDDRLVLLIQGLDREWFENWLKTHSPPPGARLISPLE